METTGKDNWHSRGYLPHFDAPGALQHVCFRLGDSLPRQTLLRLGAQTDDLQRLQKIEQLLDVGHGSCLLARPRVAEIVQRLLLAGDGNEYLLLGWVIMPNHVHVLIEQWRDVALCKVVKGWKGRSSRLIRSAYPDDCIQPLWHRDYWDRFIRNQQHLQNVVHYIENNPVAAGLVTQATDWQWSSANQRVVGM
ncbi:REP-associated tyrosine transposase [Halopseudomonas yangmingensis]|uniref:Putative DNA methylase n=1 Tax=Halopseudomonas yangmingensis TaxID=1720063 RepID=A0A1I4T0C3_9GAMM|nr:transposase [Halopseudomonas yangmingensis]SFM70101.1 putative DNA methylase [Halopseudomonas yangmingensis]